MKRGIRLSVLIVAVVALFLLHGCGEQSDLKKNDFKTEYQGVLLSGGLVYYGKIEKISRHFIEVSDVFYVQNQQDPQTKAVRSILVKRGKEFHAPDRMYINTAQVIMIEPVAADSSMGKMIKDLKSRFEEEGKK